MPKRRSKQDLRFLGMSKNRKSSAPIFKVTKCHFENRLEFLTKMRENAAFCPPSSCLSRVFDNLRRLLVADKTQKAVIKLV